MPEKIRRGSEIPLIVEYHGTPEHWRKPFECSICDEQIKAYTHYLFRNRREGGKKTIRFHVECVY